MTPENILEQIESGKPFEYPASMKKGRIWKIENFEFNGVKRLILSANNLKTKEVLTKKQALNIITNTLEIY